MRSPQKSDALRHHGRRCAALAALTLASIVSSVGSVALAATVTPYGILDTGFLYSRDRDENSLSGDVGERYRASARKESLVMESSINYGSRVGLKGVEELGPNLKVGFVLEGGLSTDTGALTSSDRIFAREAQLYVEGTYGRLAFGEMGPLTGSIGSYHILSARADALDGGYFWLTRPVTDNMLTYRSPEVAGLRAYFQYSLERDAREGLEGTSRAERYAAAGVTFDRGPLQTVFTLDRIERGSDSESPVGDAWSVALGGNVKQGDWTIYGGFQLGRNETEFAFMNATSFFREEAFYALGGAEASFDGWSATTGLLVEHMPGAPEANMQVSLFWSRADADLYTGVGGKTPAWNEDLTKYGFMTMYILPMSSHALWYVGGAGTWEKLDGFSHASGSLKHTLWQFAVGLAMAF